MGILAEIVESQHDALKKIIIQYMFDFPDEAQMSSNKFDLNETEAITSYELKISFKKPKQK